MSRFDDWYWYTGRSLRDSSGYKSGYRSSLGWETSRKTGESYSSAFWRPSLNKDKAVLITRAYNLAKEMILVMDTPTKVNVRILNDRSDPDTYTDGKSVFVSTTVFDDTKLQETEAVDIFSGLTIHEGCHLLYSDMKAFNEWIEFHTIAKSSDIELRKHIFNILEDERVENKLGENKPGLMAFLEKAKDYMFGNSKDSFKSLMSRELDSGETEVELKFKRISSVLSLIIRYPKFLEDQDLDVCRNFFNRVQEFIIPLPENTVDAIKSADNICDLLIDTLGEELEYKDISKKTIRQEIGNIVKGLSKLGKGPSGGYCDSGFSKLLESLRGADFISSRDCETCINTTEDYRRKKVSESVSQNKGALGKILDGRIEKGSKDRVIFVKDDTGWGSTYEEANYRTLRKQIQEYIPSIKRILVCNNKDYTGIVHGCKTGILDTTKLAEAYQGVEHVYYKHYQVKTKKTSVCIVIDESGSMGGSREKEARKAAILLNEAFKGIPGINLYIYGHSADELRTVSNKSTDIYVYKEPGMKGRDTRLANSHARWENRDGEALREIAKRIRKKDSNEVLMFVLSDGDPSATDYRGDKGREDTRKAVLELEAQGFIPVQVCISSWCAPEGMFKHYIEINNLDDLVQQLGKEVKKAVLKSSKKEETIL